MKLHFLGTCSGTEPFPDMHHVSWILEVGGINYWFDAGENCAHSAVTMGIDVMNTKSLFISHPHFDHTGGIAGIFACVNKFVKRNGKALVNNNSLKIFSPCSEIIDCVKSIYSGSLNHHFYFDIEEYDMRDGLLFEDENIRVSAIHNTHLKEDGSSGWHSYSFLIEAEGKRIVYSGDVGHITELDLFVDSGCDMLIMETGHHKVEDVLKYAVDKKVKNLRFNHHGRQIIENRPEMERLADKTAEKNPISVKILHDKQTELF